MKLNLALVPILTLLLLSGCTKEKKVTDSNMVENEVKKHPAYLEKNIVSAPLTDAEKSRQQTDEATAKEYERVLSSEAGKKSYTKLMEIFNTNIATIASQGYNDTFVVTFLNNRALGIPEAFSGLNQLEQNYVRDKVIFDLEQKGYIVKRNEYWNNPESINISVSW